MPTLPLDPSSHHATHRITMRVDIEIYESVFDDEVTQQSII